MVARGQQSAAPGSHGVKVQGLKGRQKLCPTTCLSPFQDSVALSDNQGQRAPLRCALAPGYHLFAPSVPSSGLHLFSAFLRTPSLQCLTPDSISSAPSSGLHLFSALLWTPSFRTFGAYPDYHLFAPSVPHFGLLRQALLSPVFSSPLLPFFF